MTAEDRRPQSFNQEQWEQCFAALINRLGPEAGLAAIEILLSTVGGQTLHIPADSSLRRAARDMQLILDFNGANLNELAHTHGIDPRQVRRILDEARARARDINDPPKNPGLN